MAEETVKGAFMDSLKRNNKQIRDDRAIAIAEAAEVKYRRSVEDLEQNIKEMKRERENMLDMSPTHADSLVLATDFNSDAFVAKDIELGVKIRNDEIKLEIAQKQYTYLFGCKHLARHREENGALKDDIGKIERALGTERMREIIGGGG